MASVTVVDSVSYGFGFLRCAPLHLSLGCAKAFADQL
jgi:hypothetical protein